MTPDEQYCAVCKAIACAGFVTLVIFDHPWLGLLCFFFAASIDGTLTGNSKSEHAAGREGAK